MEDLTVSGEPVSWRSVFMKLPDVIDLDKLIKKTKKVQIIEEAQNLVCKLVESIAKMKEENISLTKQIFSADMHNKTLTCLHMGNCEDCQILMQRTFNGSGDGTHKFPFAHLGGHATFAAQFANSPPIEQVSSIPAPSLELSTNRSANFENYDGDSGLENNLSENCIGNLTERSSVFECCKTCLNNCICKTLDSAPPPSFVTGPGSPRNMTNKCNIKLISSSQGRGVAMLLNNQSKFINATSTVKPGALMNEILSTSCFRNEDAVVVLGGGNDVSIGEGDSVVTNLSNFLDSQKDLDIKIIICGILNRYHVVPENIIDLTILSLNNKIAELCCRYKNVKFLSTANIPRVYFTKHGQHLNIKGKSWIADNIANLLGSCNKSKNV